MKLEHEIDQFVPHAGEELIVLPDHFCAVSGWISAPNNFLGKVLCLIAATETIDSLEIGVQKSSARVIEHRI